jgi:hypothetical protein
MPTEEKEAMLKEEWEFDKKKIHQNYKDKFSVWTTNSHAPK